MTFRRSGWRLLPWYLYLVPCWAFAVLFTVAFCVALFLRDPWNLERVFTTGLIGFLIYPTTRNALGVHRWIRRFREHFLAIDSDGVRFRLPGTEGVLLAWDQIDGVTREIPRARRAAREITDALAARAR